MLCLPRIVLLIWKRGRNGFDRVNVLILIRLFGCFGGRSGGWRRSRMRPLIACVSIALARRIIIRAIITLARRISVRAIALARRISVRAIALAR